MELSRILISVAIFIVLRFIGNYIKNRVSDPAATMAHGKVIAVDNDVIFKALTSSGPVVIDFFATWCGPCKAIAPVVGQLSEKYPNVRFLQVDVDKLQQVSRSLGVTAMPTFAFFKDGKEVGDRVRGADPKALENAVKSLAA